MRPRRLTLLVLALCGLCAGIRAANPGERPVPHRVIPPDSFQAFVCNWDDARHPILVARIASPEQFTAWFHPAPVMGPRRPFAPEPALYAREELLLVARVGPPCAAGASALEAVRLVAREGELILHYRYREPDAKATYTVKHWLLVAVPRDDARRVRFVEGERTVARLEPARGVWSLPPPPSR